uniref:Uncharacterized protein n=1 Tax=Ciona savignyi TaxID=51511 RepID=H2ZL93_CIOSA
MTRSRAMSPRLKQMRNQRKEPQSHFWIEKLPKISESSWLGL